MPDEPAPYNLYEGDCFFYRVFSLGAWDLKRFDVMDRVAREAMRLRKNLVLKKLRIFGTLQSVSKTEEPRVQEIMDFLRSTD